MVGIEPTRNRSWPVSGILYVAFVLDVNPFRACCAGQTAKPIADHSQKLAPEEGLEKKISYNTTYPYKETPMPTYVTLTCGSCQIEFQRPLRQITKGKIREDKLSFCSRKCKDDHHNKKITVSCLNCQKGFEKKAHEIIRNPNHFCSRSCSASYNNRNKKHGTRRSKLEVWLESQLSEQYPELEIHYNRSDAIQSELDIFIPSLSLAFELNGIFHYEPIYGIEKLASIQHNDECKLQACLENNIKLCILDVSCMKYFKETKGQVFLNTICLNIDSELSDS